MLKDQLDQIPQKNFYLISGANLLDGSFPYKKPSGKLLPPLLIAVIFAHFAFTVNNYLHYDFPLCDWVMIILGGMLALLLVLCILFGIRPLARKMPCAACNAVSYGWRCFATAYDVFAAFMFMVVLVDDVFWEYPELGKNIAIGTLCVVDILTTFISSAMIRARIVRRIKDGKYRFGGEGYWDRSEKFTGIKAVGIVAGAVMMLMVAAGIMNAINGIGDFIDFDFQALVNLFGMLLLFIFAMALNVIVSYFNVNREIMVYSYRRFKDDIAGFETSTAKNGKDKKNN